MTKLSSLGVALMLACAAGAAHAQTPAPSADANTTSRGTDNASIYARTATQQPQTRATPAPVPTVRPLSQ